MSQDKVLILLPLGYANFMVEVWVRESGAVLFAAKQISKTSKKINIVVILPDRGEKYLSTKLFV